MKLSYAQNLEDLTLAHVFPGKRDGFYVDVGGGHPVADNVTFWFYLQGWHGLIVEPQAGLCELYAHVRPRDIAVATLVGAAEGEIDFHMVDRLHGFSTTVIGNAEGAAGFGAGYTTVKHPVTTLKALCARHDIRHIDVLKIDVEGAEADVLAGMDWSIARPRVIVIEAIVPGSMEDASAGWEPFVLEQGYRFAFFDGLNRFYVADEAAELMARFPAEKLDWGSVEHLWDHGRAPQNTGHADHQLAMRLVDGFLASLPKLDPVFLKSLLLKGEDAGERPDSAALRDALLGALQQESLGRTHAAGHHSGAQLDTIMASDAFRAALGRIACGYDGGHLMDD
jgi:FkbM family methyltransferase